MRGCGAPRDLPWSRLPRPLLRCTDMLLYAMNSADNQLAPLVSKTPLLSSSLRVSESVMTNLYSCSKLDHKINSTAPDVEEAESLVAVGLSGCGKYGKQFLGRRGSVARLGCRVEIHKDCFGRHPDSAAHRSDIATIWRFKLEIHGLRAGMDVKSSSS